ncbi:MAG TPA: hypothetical protein VNX00_00580, partial [Herbaspirillum sp.]|nr:hypothetical protein [Herbaspirillum sp.]
IGYEVSRLNQQTNEWIPEVPVISSYYDPVTGHILAADSTMPFPEAFIGTVVRLMNADGTGVRYLPFASYQDADGTLMHQVVIGGRRYSFRMNREPGAMASGGDVTLYPATVEEMQKFEKYQELLEMRRNAPGIDLANAVKLRDQSGAFQREFETVMSSVKKKLIDAIAVFEDRPELVSTICKKFTGRDAAATTLLSEKLSTLMRRMLASFPDFSDQSGHAIGFFTNPGGLEFNRVSGLAVRNSMAYPLDFRYMKEAVIFLNTLYCGPAIPLERRIANLLHEWTHALVGTWDSMTGEGGAPLYVAHHLGRYDLAALIEAARLPGSDPGQHAVWVEHIIMILANFRYPSTRYLSEPFLFGSSYATSYAEITLPG